MSKVRMYGTTSGYSEIVPPAVAGDQAFSLPGIGGTFATTQNAQTLDSKTLTNCTISTGYSGSVIVQGTSQVSTAGTSIDFTGIPSWAKRVTVVFEGVSLSGSSNLQVQLGDSGGIEATGYTGVSQYFGTGAASQTPTIGAQLVLAVTGASYTQTGQVLIANITGNTWSIWGMSGATSAYSGMTICSKTLSATLDRVRITSVNGTDTFDAGTINILYEG